MRRYFLLLLLMLVCALPALAAPRADAKSPQIIGSAPGAIDLQFSPDGRWLLATLGVGEGEESSPLKVFDLSKRSPTREFDATFARFAPDSRSIVVFSRQSSELQIVDLVTGRIARRFRGLTARSNEVVSDAQFQKKGRELAVVTPFRVWRLDAKTGAKLGQTPLQIQINPLVGNGLFGQTLLRDGRRLLYLNYDEAWIYDARTGRRTGKADVGELSPGQKFQWSWNAETGDVRVSDFAGGHTLWRGELDDNPQFSADGKTLIVANSKTGVRLLDPRSGKTLRKLAVPVPASDDLFNPTYALSPDNRFWFARRGDQIVRYQLR